MASQLKTADLSKETIEIIDTINRGNNFLLSGGAGSGKTYSLVEIIETIIIQKPLSRIACITYTNAATQEVENRATHDNLHVSTIHDFLWGTIKHYQSELKLVLLDLINDENNTKFRVLSPDGDPEPLDNIDGEIEYKDYLKLRSGIISHDELLLLADEMYRRYPKLCKIVSDRYSFILVDEYQDTSPLVVTILLEHFSHVSKRNIVGFFGDSMQAIYEDGVGDLEAYKGEGKGQVFETQKEQNRRNPLSVISLANLLRTDSLVQTPSDDAKAPNMDARGTPKQGSAKFLYSKTADLSLSRNYLNWDFDSKDTKELNLTHNLIAGKAGFSELMRIYDSDKILDYAKRVKDFIKKNERDYDPNGKTFEVVIQELKKNKEGKLLKAIEPTDGQKLYIAQHNDVYSEALKSPFLALSSLYIDKDMLIDDKKSDENEPGRIGSNRDDLIKHLFKIQNIVQLYLSGNFNEFLRITDFRVRSHKDKILLKHEIENFSNIGKQTIGEIINLANEKGLIKKDDRLENFIKIRRYIFDQVVKLPFSEFQCLFKYLEGQTPFSTQHKTKGREYDNVLVIMDNGQWNSYNFDYLFTGEGKDTVIERTRKIVYVCCTRARENLALFYHNPSPGVLETAKTWFGEHNLVDLDKVH
ncbi:UvrD-helicase domain-containing protein [Pseudomonas moraviensis]|uniref:UvrD-helicase domain-containing protein n=1 Tax=Pseudomonas moraviensis TaxID=321662 RepID=UPI000F78F065|nr:UvrD-helicase domain-containing protein [Pseudomonas moraviensis]RRW54950.1 ATP-dependent helicase [Pseudomonas moraviensis]